MRPGRRARLVRIGRLAQLRERLTEKALGEAMGQERSAAADVDRADDALAALGTPGTGEAASVSEFTEHLQRSRLRADDAQRAKAARDEAMEKVLEARRDWLDAARRRKGIDEMTARHRAARAMVASRAAQRVLDDLAQHRRNRP